MCVLLRWWTEHYYAISQMVGQVYFLEMSQRISLSILCNLCFLGRNGHKLAWNFSKIQSLYIRHWLSIRNAFSTEEGKVTNVLFSLQVSSFSLAHVSFSLTSNQILFLLTYNYCTSSLWYFVQIYKKPTGGADRSTFMENQNGLCLQHQLFIKSWRDKKRFIAKYTS